MIEVPAGMTTFRPHPVSTSRWSGVHPREEAMRREFIGDAIQCRCLRTSAVGGSDRRRFLGDVDADRTPGDAPTAADAARGPELIPPRTQLVGHPLAVAAAHRLANRSAVDVREVAREAGRPFPHPLTRVAVRRLRLDIITAEAGRAGQRAVAAAQAACGDVVPARVLEIALQQLGQPVGVHGAAHARCGFVGDRFGRLEVGCICRMRGELIQQLLARRRSGFDDVSRFRPYRATR